jgi:hypothetical protein
MPLQETSNCNTKSEGKYFVVHGPLSLDNFHIKFVKGGKRIMPDANAGIFLSRLRFSPAVIEVLQDVSFTWRLMTV